MSDRAFERAVTDWLEDGSDGTPKHALDAVLLAVKTTPQERDLGIPWRIPMPASTRSIALAAVVIVAVVGVGGFIFLSDRDQGVATQPTAPASAAPSPSTSPSASAPPAPSIDVPTGFVTFTSPLNGYTLAYPEGWTADAADSLGSEDQFVNADGNFGVGFRSVPAGDGADVATVDGLTEWAQAYCTQRNLGACDTYADRLEAMCLADGSDPCRAAILVRSVGSNPEEDAEHAFFGDWARALPESAPHTVMVLGTGRGDAYPGAAPFGGAVQLLKTMLASMGVTPASSASGAPNTPGINAWTPFTSPVYGYTLSYPEGWEVGPATREWQAGGDNDSGEDQFVRPEGDLGVGVRVVRPGEGADTESVDGLKVIAEQYCRDLRLTGCDTFPDRSEPMCLEAGGDPCRAAILVRSDGGNPEEDAEFAFFGDWNGAPAGSGPDSVIAVGTGRGDAYPGAAVYGGVVELLKGFLTTMGVTAP